MSKVLVKSAWGSDDPTKAAFPFLHANALLPSGRGSVLDARSSSKRSRPGRLAPPGRSPANHCGARHTDPRVRRMLKGSWSP